MNEPSTAQIKLKQFQIEIHGLVLVGSAKFQKEHVYSAMIIISLIFNQKMLNLRYYLLTKFYCVAFQVHPATAVSILKTPTFDFVVEKTPTF